MAVERRERASGIKPGGRNYSVNLAFTGEVVTTKPLEDELEISRIRGLVREIRKIASSGRAATNGQPRHRP